MLLTLFFCTGQTFLGTYQDFFWDLCTLFNEIFWIFNAQNRPKSCILGFELRNFEKISGASRRNNLFPSFNAVSNFCFLFFNLFVIHCIGRQFATPMCCLVHFSLNIGNIQCQNLIDLCILHFLH